MLLGCKKTISPLLPLPFFHNTHHTVRPSRYNPVSMDAFDTQVYNTFYGSSTGNGNDEPSLAHKLSLLFMVLAIGSLMNIDLPAYNIEAEKYHQLARAALFHTSIFDSPTLIAVQALVSVFASLPLSVDKLMRMWCVDSIS